ncbi:Gfo/Idh/MocA family protein [candidate division KSB1 bacterium]
MSKLRTGIVGVGHLGEFHLQKLLKIEEVELAGFWEIDENRRSEISGKYNVKAFDSLVDLTNDIESVIIVAPTSFHRELAVECAEKGLHVFVEKPLAVTVSEADEIIETADKNNVKLQVGHIERFNSSYRSLISEFSYDLDPRFIESHRLASFNPRGLDVSVIHDLMIHDIDIILNLMKGKLEKIEANGVGVISDSFDIVNARLIFDDGAAANVTASRISQKTMRKMRIFQRDNYISLDFVKGETEIFRIAGASENLIKSGLMPVSDLENDGVKQSLGFKKISSDGKDSIEIELREFFRSIRENSTPPVTGLQARNALEVASKIAEKTIAK